MNARRQPGPCRALIGGLRGVSVVVLLMTTIPAEEPESKQSPATTQQTPPAAAPADPATLPPKDPAVGDSPSGAIPETPAAKEDEPPPISNPYAEKWGIEIEGIRLTAGGYMLDFRFKVLDAKKAAPLLDHKRGASLTDQASGAKFAVPAPPKLGPMRTSGRSTPPKAGFIIFANPGQFLKRGDVVTVQVGAFKATDLMVE